MGYLEIRKTIPEHVFLLPVSKTKSYEAVLEVYKEGARAFGENRIQEIEKKFPLPEERPEGMLVFLIGQLQKNKVRKAVRLCNRIESVDSLTLLELIDKECGKIGKKIDVLLEFNSSGEESKSGFRSEEDLKEAAKASRFLDNVNLLGIMTIGPLGMDEQKNRKAFRRTRILFEEVSSSICPLSVLSMGMSSDYLQAIDEKSNEVRIGTAIFGGRA